MREHTLLLEIVVALKAAAETIKGLAGLADPESDGVNCSSKRTHFRFSLRWISLAITEILQIEIWGLRDGEGYRGWVFEKGFYWAYENESESLEATTTEK